MNDVENAANRHVDEMTLLLYVERQLDRERAQEVSLHTQTCTRCLTLLRALDRESRLLTRAMLEQDEPLPARLSEFRAQAKKSMQWIWGVVFSLGVLGSYALYSGYIEPWQQQLDQAGFGGTNLLNLLIFQGAFWKGWQSMFTLFEVLALLAMAGLGMFAFRKLFRRGSALAVMFASLGLLLVAAPPASAAEFRKGETVEVRKDETVKGDLFFTGKRLKIDGTVDGDVYAFGHQLDVGGHVTGDVICFAQGVRISGQVDGNVRSFVNNITISGNVERSVSSFNEIFNLDSSGRIGRSLTVFGNTITLDGKLGRDLLGMFHQATLSGPIGGSVDARGDSLTISSGAQIDGRASFEGNQEATVSSDAKLASPLEFKKMEHKRHGERDSGHYVWRVIWTGTFILFGLVLFALMPSFSRESVALGEHAGVSFGVGVLVLFVPIVAVLACVTVIGFFVGLSTLLLWLTVFIASEVVVGTLVGQWVLGKSAEFWPLVSRMALGIVLVRIVTTVPFVGGLASLAVTMWGMGAISLALYRRLQPVIAPSIPSVPAGPMGNPLPPGTTVGGIPSA